MDRVVIFIFIDKDKILVEKRILENFDKEEYLIPGGRVKEDIENLEQGLLREMQEELGIIPLEFYPLALDEKITGLKGQTLIPFIIKNWQGMLPKKILDKGNPLVWLKFEEVLKTKVEPTKKIVTALLKHLPKENDSFKS